jgi:gluconate 2-dehydrogenase alpha chain
MAAETAHADVVLVGLGGAGGIAADLLTAAGVEVVALEAGPRYTPSDMTLDELRNDIRNWMSDPKSRFEIPTWRTSADEPAVPAPWPMLMANGVGGSTVHYETVSFRFMPWNFATRSLATERYGPSAIPADSTVADWPMTYEELEADYDYVERAIGVSGRAARVAGMPVDPEGNHFEAERSRPYPMPPLRSAGWPRLLADAARGLGWHPYPAPAAINSEPYDGRGTCTYCGFCQSNGCHVDAKGGTGATVIPRAEATGLLKVVTGARVTEIVVGHDGLVSGVRYVRDGAEHFQSGSVVLVGTFVYENVRLLLMSTSPAFPNGLANNSGQVGQHYMVHTTPWAYGRFPGLDLNIYNGTMAQATCVEDFNGDNFDHTGLGFIGGGMSACWAEFKPIAVAGGPFVPPHIPRWGSEWKRWLIENARSVGAVSSQFDPLSYEDNFLDLDPDARDAFQLPRIRVTNRLHRNEQRGVAYLTERLREWLVEAGAVETWASDGRLFEGRHAYGGTRMGLDPDTSVVDRYGYAHEVPNLGILGASAFPTAGGVNPTLTVQALASWTTRHLLAQWSTRAGRA